MFRKKLVENKKETLDFSKKLDKSNGVPVLLFMLVPSDL